jgi:hypothetical protein
VFERMTDASLSPTYQADGWSIKGVTSVQIRPIEKATGRISDATGSITLAAKQALHSEEVSLNANYNDGSRFGCIAKPGDRIARTQRISERKLLIGDASRSQTGNLMYSYGPDSDQYSVSLSGTRNELTDTLTNRSIRAARKKAESPIFNWTAAIATGLDGREDGDFYQNTLSLKVNYQWTRLTSLSSSGSVTSESDGARRLEGAIGTQSRLTRDDAIQLGLGRNVLLHSSETGSVIATANYTHLFSEDTELAVSGQRLSYDDSARSTGFWLRESLTQKLYAYHAVTLYHGAGNQSPQLAKAQKTYGASYTYQVADGAKGGIRYPFGLSSAISYNRDEATFLNGETSGMRKFQVTLTANF